MAISLWKAVTDEDLERANALVDQEYRKVGYRLPEEPILPPIDASFPKTTVFIAKDENHSLCGTIAIISDTEDGLPIDAAFHDELASFRANGMHLAEIGRLAIGKIDGDDAKKILPSLYVIVLGFALMQNFDALVITINPKHDPLYQQFGFQPLGIEKPYPFLQNAPAIARILFLKDMDKKYFRFLPKDPQTISFSEKFQNGAESISLL